VQLRKESGVFRSDLREKEKRNRSNFTWGLKEGKKEKKNVEFICAKMGRKKKRTRF